MQEDDEEGVSDASHSTNEPADSNTEPGDTSSEPEDDISETGSEDENDEKPAGDASHPLTNQRIAILILEIPALNLKITFLKLAMKTRRATNLRMTQAIPLKNQRIAILSLEIPVLNLKMRREGRRK